MESLGGRSALGAAWAAIILGISTVRVTADPLALPMLKGLVVPERTAYVHIGSVDTQVSNLGVACSQSVECLSSLCATVTVMLVLANSHVADLLMMCMFQHHANSNFPLPSERALCCLHPHTYS